jgi:hypothetical protein
MIFSFLQFSFTSSNLPLGYWSLALFAAFVALPVLSDGLRLQRKGATNMLQTNWQNFRFRGCNSHSQSQECAHTFVGLRFIDSV